MTEPNRQNDDGPIRVSEVSIAQLSRGLYRSNAAAFKELVSNAWDADATEVRIDTNFPEFDFISCVDNGPGMPLEQFLSYFAERGIGYCFKRRGHRNTTDKFHRPIIGRLGIGMLAIGQLCYSFHIESHYKDEDGQGKAYIGEIVLLDEGIPDIEESISTDTLEREDIEVGTWNYHVISYEEAKQGFRIFSDDVRDTFTEEMKKEMQDTKRSALSFQLQKLDSKFFKDREIKSIRETGPYLETIWELCILCPLPYYDDPENYPFQRACFLADAQTDEFQNAIALVEEKHSAFRNWNFKVIFDGVELRRLIQLPRDLNDPDANPRIFYLSYDNVVADRKLKFTGYLYAQTKAVRPLELSGVQIRLRGVGIGGYDHTFLKYYKEIETIRSRWVSGELFVDEGLEVALNIDRDSFNEHDEHFKFIQQEIHNKLGPVFVCIEGVARLQREEKRNTKSRELGVRLEEIVSQSPKGKIEVLYESLGRDAPAAVPSKDGTEILVNVSGGLLRKKKAAMMLRHIALAYWISAGTAETEEERFNIFHDLLKKILGELA